MTRLAQTGLLNLSTTDLDPRFVHSRILDTRQPCGRSFRGSQNMTTDNRRTTRDTSRPPRNNHYYRTMATNNLLASRPNCYEERDLKDLFWKCIPLNCTEDDKKQLLEGYDIILQKCSSMRARDVLRTIRNSSVNNAANGFATRALVKAVSLSSATKEQSLP
jgi:hypothetical protein